MSHTPYEPVTYICHTHHVSQSPIFPMPTVRLNMKDNWLYSNTSTDILNKHSGPLFIFLEDPTGDMLLEPHS